MLPRLPAASCNLSRILMAQRRIQGEYQIALNVLASRRPRDTPAYGLQRLATEPAA